MRHDIPHAAWSRDSPRPRSRMPPTQAVSTAVSAVAGSRQGHAPESSALTDEAFGQKAGIYAIATIGGATISSSPSMPRRDARADLRAGRWPGNLRITATCISAPDRGTAPARGPQPGGAVRPLEVSLSQLGKYQGRQPPERHRPRRRRPGARRAGRLLLRGHARPGRGPAGLSDRPQARLEALEGWTGFAEAVARAADTHLDEDRRQALGSLVRAVDHALSGQTSVRY